MNRKFILYFLFTIYIFIIIGMVEYESIFISLYVIVTYMVYKPNRVFHPNNMLFAFSFLYICLPSSIYYIYEIYDIEYILPWGKLYEWDSLEKLTYYYMLYMFVIPFFAFYYFTKNTLEQKTYQVYKVKNNWLFILIIILLILIFIFVYRTGGASGWLFNYQYTYLVGRTGSGLFNVLILLFSNIVVFLLGLKISQLKFNSKKIIWILISFVIICIVAYLQGFKSRFIFLTLLFFFPFLINIKLSFKYISILGFLFFGLIILGNYLRSDGFYNSSQKIIEYMISYFNVYPLHDIIVKDFELDIFETIHHIFVKPLIIIGLIDSDIDFDISVMLTKIYFPQQWYEMKATQQWPLATELHINYYGMLFGWIPLIIYCYIISFLYKNMILGKLGFSLIYLIEMIRIFSTFRGVFLPWILPLDVILYILIYILIKRSINIEKNYI